MTKAATYYRVSTDDQEKDGYGLKTQSDACKQYVKANKYELVAEFTDVITGRTDNRPELHTALIAAKDGGFDVLVLFDHTRLGRNIDVNRNIRNNLQSHGVVLEYVKGGSYDQQSRIGKVIDYLGDWQAEGEIETMVERSRPARKSAVKAGNLQLTRRPFGYQIEFSNAESGQTITPDPDEAKHIKTMFQWAAEGMLGTEIARRLNQRQITKPNGRQWIGKEILKHLRREIYKGEYVFGKTVVLDSQGKINLGKEKDAKAVDAPETDWTRKEVPALVTEALWDRANSKLTARNRKHQPNLQNDYPFMLRGRIFCMECGTRYHTDIQKSRTSKKQRTIYLHYRHPTGMKAKGCLTRNNFQRDEMEDMVKVWIAGWIDNPEVDWDQLVDSTPSDDSHISKAVDKLKRQLEELTRERPRLVRAIAKGLIDDTEISQEIERIEWEKADLETELTGLEDQLDHVTYFTLGPIPEDKKDWSVMKNDPYKNYLPEEWQALVAKHSIEIEVNDQGEVWLSFEQDPETYRIDGPKGT